MADYVPPPGPPPPKVPEGWKAQWNDQYKEWFYVNLHTKQSQWEKPTEPAYPSTGGGGAPPPPTYDHNTSQSTYPEKSASYLNSNNPYGTSGQGGSNQNLSSDEAYARKLQEEENARLQASGSSHGAGAGNRGTSDGYYGGSGSAPQYGGQSQYGGQPQYGGSSQPELPAREAKKSGGFLGKLLSKTSSSSRPQQGYGGYPQQGGYGGYPQQGGYGGYPQQGYGGYPQHGGGGMMGGGMMGGGHGYPPRRSGGMGAGGAAALGVGGGLLGGMMLANAMDDHDQGEYNEGYQDGQNDDYGGGDDGGDMGGDF